MPASDHLKQSAVAKVFLLDDVSNDVSMVVSMVLCGVPRGFNASALNAKIECKD
jgi:hypothetical protein